jgi:hypothetical protein
VQSIDKQTDSDFKGLKLFIVDFFYTISKLKVNKLFNFSFDFTNRAYDRNKLIVMISN